LLKQKTDSFQT